MRVFSTVLAFVLAFCVMSVALVFAQSGKSICIGKLSSGADPSLIPVTSLTGMTNRGRGSYTVGISLCSAMAAPGACSNQGTGYVAISNSTGCNWAFDTVMQRPTAVTGGFMVKYGSSKNKNTADLTILCDPLSPSNALTSRSNKFAQFTNKAGGVGTLLVLSSHAACAGKVVPTVKPTGTRPAHSEFPSGSSDMPSFPSGGSGSSDMPSGGSHSDMPTGGSGSSAMPSGGSMSGSSGMPPFPSGGSHSDSGMPSGGSSNMPSGGGSGSSNMPPLPSGGSQSGMPSGGSGSEFPSGDNTPTPMPPGPDTPPPIPSDLPPMSGSGSAPSVN